MYLLTKEMRNVGSAKVKLRNKAQPYNVNVVHTCPLGLFYSSCEYEPIDILHEIEALQLLDLFTLGFDY